MILSCIIIEDEPLAVEKLAGFIAKIPSLNLKQSFNNGIDGMLFMQNNAIDIVFLDIQMDQLTGIQLLETLNIKPYVIITSAYSEYALKGYELNVFDYLLKPFGFDRFLKAVNKVVDDASMKNIAETEKGHFFVKTEYRLENICINDILYVEGMKEYLRIVLPTKKVMTKMSFKKLMEQLPVKQFIQVHKSWLVQLNKIERVERGKIIIGSTEIPIGNTYKTLFNELL